MNVKGEERKRNEDLELRGLDCQRAAEAINPRPTAKRQCFQWPVALDYSGHAADILRPRNDRDDGGLGVHGSSDYGYVLYHTCCTAPTKTSNGCDVASALMVTTSNLLHPHPIPNGTLIYISRRYVREPLRQNGWPRTARFRGSSRDPRGSAQSWMKRSICCRTQRPPRDGDLQHFTARQEAGRVIWRRVSTAAAAPRSTRDKPLPVLSLHHSRLSARLCWSHRQQGMVRGQHSLHDSLRMRNPDPAAVLGHQLSPSPERRKHGYLIPRARGVPQQPSSHVNLSAAMWGSIVPCAGSRSLDMFGPKEQPSSSRGLLDRSRVGLSPFSSRSWIFHPDGAVLSILDG